MLHIQINVNIWEFRGLITSTMRSNNPSTSYNGRAGCAMNLECSGYGPPEEVVGQ